MGVPFHEMKSDPDLIAAFVHAIVVFENQDLKTFQKEGYTVLIEGGQRILAFLFVDSSVDEGTCRAKLKRIISDFENQYRPYLENWRGDIRHFRPFALRILTEYPYEEIGLDLVPRPVKGKTDHDTITDSIPWSVGSTDQKLKTILGFVNGKRTVREIVDASGFDRRETTALLSILKKFGIITLSRPLSRDSILIRRSEPTPVMRVTYGDQLSALLELCDGTRTFGQICEKLPYTYDVARTVTQALIDSGVIGFVDDAEAAEG